MQFDDGSGFPFLSHTARRNLEPRLDGLRVGVVKRERTRQGFIPG